METASNLLTNFWLLTLDASPWLLLGLLIAGLMKAWLPNNLLSKHLGQGNGAIVKAALIGAPLPLCSCGVIPVATELRRNGASAPATSSFLVATPETGVDSITVSYAMLGPVFAIFRPVTAVMSAIVTGLLVKTAPSPAEHDKVTEKTSSCCPSKKQNVQEEKASCCSSKQAEEISTEIKPESSCCSSKQKTKIAVETSAIQKSLLGIKYALTKLIDDLIAWLFVGLLFATLVKTFIPTEFYRIWR